jgi:hypothetical protein
MKTLIAAALVLALAGCESDTERASRACAYTRDVPERNNRIEKWEATEAARVDRDNALAAAMIAGGALNFRQPAPRFTTCTAAGCITR